MKVKIKRKRKISINIFKMNKVIVKAAVQDQNRKTVPIIN